MKKSNRQKFLSFVVGSLFGICLTSGASLIAETSVPTEGLVQPLVSGTPVVFEDSLTGTGTLTLQTADGTRADATTYGVLQLGEGSDLSAFSGGVQFDRAIFDLNGRSLTSGLTSLTNTAATPADDLVVGKIVNSGADSSTVSLSGSVTLNIPLGQLDGANSDIKLVMNSTNARTFNVANYHTGGTEITNGTVSLNEVDAFGTGPISFNNVTLSEYQNKAYEFDQTITLSGAGLRIRQTGASTTNFTGDITGSGDFTISYDSNAVTFSGVAKTYTGKTIIGTTTNAWTNDVRSKAILKLGLENAISTVSSLVFGGNSGGTVGGAVLDMNGYNQTVVSAEGQGNLINSGTEAATLTVSTPNSALTFLDMRLDANTSLRLGDGAGTWYVVSSGSGTLSLGTATLANTPAQWGRSTLSGNNDTTNSRAPIEYTSASTCLDTNDVNLFPGNTTMSYSAHIDVTADTDVSFYKNFDDNGYVWVTPINEDGSLGTKIALINNGSGTYDNNVGNTSPTSGATDVWDDVIVSTTQTLKAGQYILEVRAGQGGGGVGPTQSGTGMGFGIKTGAAITDKSEFAQYSKLTIDDTTHKLAGIDTIEVIAPKRTISSAIAIDAGETLTVQPGYKGQFVLTGPISGEGSKLIIDAPSGAVALAGKNSTYSGGTTINAQEVTIGGRSALGTGEVTVNSATTFLFNSFVVNTPATAWSEGSFTGVNALQLGTPVSVTYTGTPSNTGKDPGTNITWSYSTSVVALDDLTMYFGESFDDNAYLKITDQMTGDSSVILNNGNWNVTTYGSYTFQKGHGYEIDMRVYNGGGGAGPQKQDGWTDQSVGIGGSLNAGTVPEGNSYQLLSFNDKGELLSPSLIAGGNIVLPNNFALAAKTTLDCSGVSGKVTLNGAVSAADTLTLTGTPTSSSLGGFTFNNTISGAGGLVVDTTGTVTLNSENTYTGGTTLKQGTVVLGDSKGLGTAAVTSQSNDLTTPVTIQLNANFDVGWNWAVVANDQGSANLNSTTTPDTWDRTMNPEYLNKSYGDGASKTVVYQANLLASENVSLTFEKAYDDGGYIKVVDLTSDPTGANSTTIVINDEVWNTAPTASYDFQQGHEYSLEIRAGNGGGNNGPISVSTAGSGLGIVAKLTDGGSYAKENLYFDISGRLQGASVLSNVFRDVVLTNDLIVNSPMTIDGAGLSMEGADVSVKGVLTGRISGTDTLTLANGTFALKNPAKNSSVGTFVLENATFQLDANSGFLSTDRLEAANSVFEFDLTGIDLEAFSGIDSWIEITGDAEADNIDFENVTMTFRADELVPNTTITVPLISSDSPFAEELDDIKAIFEGDLAGYLSVLDGKLSVTLGDSSSIPEPSSWLLLILGAAGIAYFRKRR